MACRELLPRPHDAAYKVDPADELYLPKLQTDTFSNVKQLPSIADAYAVPTQRNFPGIDALHPSTGRMFQCRVSSKHDLKKGIFATVEQLDSSTNPALYVVVPSRGTFDSWIYRMKVPELPASPSAKVKRHINQLRQYVLLLEPMKLKLS